MTDLLYQTDSYLKEFTARILERDDENQAILLDRTAFYPGGGGQPYDQGRLIVGGQLWAVQRVRKDQQGVWHYLSGERTLPEKGMVVEGQIDWQRRYALMRTHTAMHI